MENALRISSPTLLKVGILNRIATKLNGGPDTRIGNRFNALQLLLEKSLVVVNDPFSGEDAFKAAVEVLINNGVILNPDAEQRLEIIASREFNGLNELEA